jgi:signal transduction histidine kinase
MIARLPRALHGRSEARVDAVTPAGGRLRNGAVQVAMARLYARYGPGVMYICTGAAVAVGLASVFMTTEWADRYLHLSGTNFWLLLALGEGGFLFALATTAITIRRPFRAIAGWTGSRRSPARAPGVWHSLVHGPFAIAGRGVMLSLLISVPISITIVIASHEPAYTAFGLFLAFATCILAAAALLLAILELTLRPMLEDVAKYLPRDFHPAALSWRLRTRAVLPLPLVTLFGALTVGAFANVGARGPARLMVVIGIALATVFVASAIFLVVTRSTLDPLDDLLAATRRVREGDLTTPVPLVTADDLGQLAHSFNQMLGELRESRARIVAAGDDARRKVERDLHDGAQQQLVLVGVKLGAAQRQILTDPTGAANALAELRLDLDRALAQLRALAHGIYPAVLEHEGLPGALREAAALAAIETTLRCDSAGRYPREVEAAVYFCCLEALQNAAKHAGDGAHATFKLSDQGCELRFDVTDDGAGFDPATTNGSAGLQNMRDRIGALGGRLQIDSAPGEGTHVRGSIPLPAPPRP